VGEALRLLVTGASGFIGGAIVTRAAGMPSWRVRAASRSPVPFPWSVELAQGADLAGDPDWADTVRGVDVVIHAAARVHVMRETAADPLAEFRRANVAGTVELARQARCAGARRFVFISSIKVNGEATPPGRPFAADDLPEPVDPYGISKHEAEVALRGLAAETGLEVVIIRPVLVYGPGVKGNFRSMMRWVQRGVPLPLGAVDNRRSLVALDNLVDLALIGATHPRAANETFLVSDGHDVSTPELLRRLAGAFGRKPRLVPVPVPLLLTAATVLGCGGVARRLLGSLQVDATKTRRLLDWKPPISIEDGLRRAVAGLS
jgi:nucleoside-diphosphate-sugar epimerase